MKILQVASYFDPHIGGLESYVKNLTRELVAEGHEVVVYTSNIPKTKQHEVYDGFEVYRFDTLFNPLGNPIAPGMLKTLFRAEEFDIVHAHDEHAFTANLAAIARKMNKSNFIVTSHGRLTYQHPIGKAILSIYEKTAMTLTLKRANAVIVLSESDKRYLTHFGINPQKITVIPNAVSPYYETLHPPPDKHSEKNGFEGNRLILYVGQLLKRKGVQNLIRAMPEIHSDVKDARLAVIGEGRYKSNLLKTVKKCGVEDLVCFLGKVSPKKLLRMYSACDVFVLPSFAEGVPTVMLEAISQSKPVVATRIPGVVDYFEEVARLVPPGDIKGLSEAVTTILTDKGLAGDLGKKGRNLLMKKFTWDKVANKMLNLYYNVINHLEARKWML